MGSVVLNLYLVNLIIREPCFIHSCHIKVSRRGSDFLLLSCPPFSSTGHLSSWRSAAGRTYLVLHPAPAASAAQQGKQKLWKSWRRWVRHSVVKDNEKKTCSVLHGLSELVFTREKRGTALCVWLELERAKLETHSYRRVKLLLVLKLSQRK